RRGKTRPHRVENLRVGISAVLRVPVVSDDADISRPAQPAEVRRAHLDVDLVVQPQRPLRTALDQLAQDRRGGKSRLAIVQTNLRLSLIRGDDQQHTALAGHQRWVVTQRRDVGGENRNRARFAAPPAYYAREFLDALAGLALSLRQLFEQRPLVVIE